VIVLAVDFATTPVVAGVAGFAVLAVLAVWLIPKRQARKWAADGIRGNELAQLENGSRATLVQIVGGVALILTFVATWTQIADTRKATNKTLQLNQTQQEADRFTRAVAELGSSNFALRLGGIYSLEQLAGASRDEREPVVQLMLAYLHRNHPVQPGAGSRWFGEACFTTRWRPLADTQAALDVILNLASDPSRLDLSRLDLRAVNLRGRNLAGADIRDSSLVYADAKGATFDDVSAFRADLRGGCFESASFVGAHLDLARWAPPYADTSQADFHGATLDCARRPSNYHFCIPGTGRPPELTRP
jgi:uncharacterized protein YjbI with pentapeptide repeats